MFAAYLAAYFIYVLIIDGPNFISQSDATCIAEICEVNNLTILSILQTVLTTLLCLVIFYPVLEFIVTQVAARVGLPSIKKAIRNLAISDADKAAACACMDEGYRRESKTFIYSSSAWYIVPFALIGLKESDTKLRSWARKWDNNVSINGDGTCVLRDGEWVSVRMLRPDQKPYDWVEPTISYDDPRYTGYAYYKFLGFIKVKPRKYLGRFAWLTRNRASQASMDQGVTPPVQIEVISGDFEISRTKLGHFLMKSGVYYHFKDFSKWYGFVRIRSYGVKLEYDFYRKPEDYQKVPTVAIGWSAKGSKD